MRISDWSSDVCSSDLVTSQGSPLLVDETTAAEIELGAQDILAGGAARAYGRQQEAALSRSRARSARAGGYLGAGAPLPTGAGQADRKSAGQGKSVAVRVDLGGCRSLKQKNNAH